MERKNKDYLISGFWFAGSVLTSTVSIINFVVRHSALANVASTLFGIAAFGSAYLTIGYWSLAEREITKGDQKPDARGDALNAKPDNPKNLDNDK
jgi:hypothetical protein